MKTFKFLYEISLNLFLYQAILAFPEAILLMS